MRGERAEGARWVEKQASMITARSPAINEHRYVQITYLITEPGDRSRPSGTDTDTDCPSPHPHGQLPDLRVRQPRPRVDPLPEHTQAPRLRRLPVNPSVARSGRRIRGRRQKAKGRKGVYLHKKSIKTS